MKSVKPNGSAEAAKPSEHELTASNDSFPHKLRCGGSPITFCRSKTLNGILALRGEDGHPRPTKRPRRERSGPMNLAGVYRTRGGAEGSTSSSIFRRHTVPLSN
jgi:hypothetical protein